MDDEWFTIEEAERITEARLTEELGAGCRDFRCIQRRARRRRYVQREVERELVVKEILRRKRSSGVIADYIESLALGA